MTFLDLIPLIINIINLIIISATFLARFEENNSPYTFTENTHT